MRAPSVSAFATVVLFGLAGAAQAGSQSVTVTDEAGQPLAQAVVMLEPASGKAAVKPMPTAEISQAKRQFNPAITVITVGTPVNFPNFDTVRHHVYSFSPTKVFELKLYAGTPTSPVVFDKPGVAVLGCNIHDQMAAWVVVVDTPYYARTNASGVAQIDNVPAGSYRLKAWHAGVPAGKDYAPQPVTVGATDVPMRIKLAAAAL